MKLYHGTAALLLPQILREGLRPRSETGRRATHSTPSNRDRVYLTDTFAVRYALNKAVADRSEKAAIVEVDLSALDCSRMYPDEDYLSEVIEDLWPPAVKWC